MRARFYTLDVFTDKAFGGNPLAMFPDAAKIPESALQSIALELNLSETVFVYPPTDPKHTRRVRIFTPVYEMPFAGHPTVGCAFALAALGEIPLDGETRIVLEGDYESLRQLLYELETAPEFLIVDDVSVTQSEMNKPLMLTLDVSTYYRLGANGA